MEMIAQIIGIFTLITVVLGLLAKEKSVTLVWFIISNLSLIATFFLLGRFLGSILIFVATIRFFVFYIFEKKNWKKSYFVLIFFEIAFVVISILFWQGYQDALILAALCLLTFAVWQDNKKIFQICYIISIVLNTTYNTMVGAYSSNLTEVVLMTTVIVALVKQNKQRKIQAETLKSDFDEKASDIEKQ